MAHSHSRVLFSYKKEWSTDTSYNIVQTNLEVYAKWKKPHERPQIGWFHLYEMSIEEANLLRQIYRILAS